MLLVVNVFWIAFIQAGLNAVTECSNSACTPWPEAKNWDCTRVLDSLVFLKVNFLVISILHVSIYLYEHFKEHDNLTVLHTSLSTLYYTCIDLLISQAFKLSKLTVFLDVMYQCFPFSWKYDWRRFRVLRPTTVLVESANWYS